jgi:hypothetical protein
MTNGYQLEDAEDTMPVERRAQGSGPDLARVREEAVAFRLQFDSAVLATVSADGLPQASYAVYLDGGDGAFYVYVSELAPHTPNLLAGGGASLLFIENEDEALHLFARRRLSFRARAEEVARTSDSFRRVLDRFERAHGAIIENLRWLEDFHLFRLTPEEGTYVAGFARAYAFQGIELTGFRHLNEAGHRRARDRERRA